MPTLQGRLTHKLDVAYLHYPVYLITGCALVIGITESIVFKKKTDAVLRAQYGTEPAIKRRRVTKCECGTVLAKARKLAKPASLDICELLGVSEVCAFPRRLNLPADCAAGILGRVYGLAAGAVRRLTHSVSLNLEQSMLASFYLPHKPLTIASHQRPVGRFYPLVIYHSCERFWACCPSMKRVRRKRIIGRPHFDT